MPVFLIPILLHLRSIAGGVMSWIARNPWMAGCLVLAAVAGVEYRSATRWHNADTIALKAISDAQTASKAELARATAEHDSWAKQQKEQNDATDKRIAAAQASDAAGLADYKRRLRTAANQGHGGAVPATGQADVAKGGIGPGSAPELDATLSADLDICTTNSRRLLEIHNEAVADSTAEGVK